MRFALLLIIAISGCGRARIESPSAAYQEARNLLRTERYEAALAKTEATVKHTGPESAWHWKLRLLKAEILLAKREAKQAQAVLAFQFPAGNTGKEELARQRLCQGQAAYLLQNYAEAEQRLNEARALAENIPALLAETELRQGSLWARNGSIDAAEPKFRKVLQFAQQQGDVYLQLNATGNIGFVLLRLSRYEEAIPWFEKTLALARSLGATVSEARVMGNLGTCYYRLRDPDKALHYFQNAEARFKDVGIRYERQIWLNHIGNIYRERREYKLATDHHQRALEIARSVNSRTGIATLLTNLAVTAIETGDWDAATRYNDEAREIKRQLNDKQGQAFSLKNAARIAAGKKDFAQAEHIFRTIVQANFEDPALQIETRAELADLYVQTGDDQKAEAEFRSTIAALERQRLELVKEEYQLSYLSSLIRFYQDYVEFLMSRGRSQAALEIAESSRARVLADKLRWGGAGKSRYAAVEFQKSAKLHRSTLLSYWLAPKRSFLWVVSGDEIAAVVLPPEAEIQTLVESYGRLIQQQRNPLEVEHPAGRKLYDTLIAPATPALSKTGKAILVPDHCLYSLNFETLPVFAATPHYWIEDVTLSITPSLGLLSANGSRREKTGGSILLIGNPESAGEEFPKLEFAAQEVQAIEKSLPALEKTIFEGPRAQPQAYLEGDLKRYSLIHFAAHASANREEPLDSAVILSGPQYRLLAKDILSKPLHADLVTISACQSAGARTYAGEGLVGFSWAFMRAGARNVIASLWNVNDRSTATIMTRLYAGLSRGAGPAEALREAKLECIRATGSHRKPYYWGPFQIYTSSPF
jgi:CHAT domain-containing protein